MHLKKLVVPRPSTQILWLRMECLGKRKEKCPFEWNLVECSNDVVMFRINFRLIFGGSFPHYFYKYVEEFLQNAGKAKQMYLFFIERLVFAPVYQAISLYFLSRFEGNNHDFAFKNLCKLYWPLLTTNWKYLSLLVFINVRFVPPMVRNRYALWGCANNFLKNQKLPQFQLRVLCGNLIGFFWVLFVASKRRKAAAEAAAAKQS